MSFIAQLSAVMFLVDFLFGVMFGVVGSASFASRREGRGYSLLHAPPDLISGGARVLHDFHKRGNGWVGDALRRAEPGDAAGPGQEPER